MLKLEIIHFSDSPRNSGPKENHRKNEEKINSMLEMAKLIDARFPLFSAEDFTPKSVRINTLLRRSKNFIPDAAREQRAEKRLAEIALQILYEDQYGQYWLLPPPKKGRVTGKSKPLKTAIKIT